MMQATNPTQTPSLAELNLTELNLTELKGIHLPSFSPWWDLSVAWWVVLIISLMFIFFGLPKLLSWWRIRRQKQALKQDIQVTYKDIRTRYQAHGNQQQLLAETSVFLRQVVLTIFSDKAVSGLIGKDWFAFLDSCWTERPAQAFQSEPMMTLLADASYRSHVEVDDDVIQDVLNLVDTWLVQVVKHV